MIIGVDASRAIAAGRTGTENYSLRLIRALAALEAGHRYRLYTNSRPASGALWPGAIPGNTAVRAIPFPRLWTHLRLSWEMLSRPPDVLFVPAHVLPLLHPRASVATVHDLGYLHYPETHRAADRSYLRWSTGWNARQATAIVVDSAATRGDLVRAYGIAPDKVHVVHLGRDETLARVPDAGRIAEVCHRLGIGVQGGPERAPSRYYLHLGTLQPRKNLARVVDAFARVAHRPELTGVQLVLAGKRGWQSDRLSERAAQLGIADTVICPGYVSDGDLPALLSGALGLVYPSLYEGFGIPVLEAGACGVPVITSNTSSLPEVAGDAALLVDPHSVDAIAEAMVRLATDEALRRELTMRGYENVKRFSWEKCARETLAVIELAAKDAKIDRQG